MGDFNQKLLSQVKKRRLEMEAEEVEKEIEAQKRIVMARLE